MEGVRTQLVGPVWAVSAERMWAISIPLLSSVKRQELEKRLLLCVSEFLCILRNCPTEGENGYYTRLALAGTS